MGRVVVTTTVENRVSMIFFQSIPFMGCFFVIGSA
jgi:hypothetical protein